MFDGESLLIPICFVLTLSAGYIQSLMFNGESLSTLGERRSVVDVPVPANQSVMFTLELLDVCPAVDDCTNGGLRLWT